MRHLGKGILTLAALAVMSVPALAQPRGPGGPGMGMAGPGIVGMPAVQTELKITDEQKPKIEKVVASIREEAMGLRDKLQDTPKGDRMAKMRELMADVNAKGNKELREILDEGQMKRLHQIELQMAGAEGLTHKYVVDHLKITDEQKSKIETVLQDSQSKMREMMADAQGGGDRQGMMEKMRELRTATTEKAMNVLSSEQKDEYKKLLGAKFEMPAFRGGRNIN